MNAKTRLLAFCLLLTLCAAVARAAPGDLDLTFGAGGKVLSAYGDTTKVVQMPDGRLLMYDTNVVSGNQVRLRTRMLTADGQPVPGWGTGGESIISLNSGPYLQATWTEGDFRLAGGADGSATGILHLSNYASNVSAANTVRLTRAIRLRADGSHDTAYAAASPADLLDPARNYDWVFNSPPFVQSDGSVLIPHACNGCDEYPIPTGLQKLGANGARAGFYSYTQPVLPQSFNALHDARVLADGKVIAAGDAGVLRFNSDGTLDTTYGNQGAVRLDTGSFADAVIAIVGVAGKTGLWIQSAAVASDGKVTLSLSADIDLGTRFESKFFLLRLSADGRLDPGFGSAGNGITQIDWSASPWRNARIRLLGIWLSAAPNGSLMANVSFDADAAYGQAIWRLDASGRQLANAPLPGIQLLLQNDGLYLNEVLGARNDGSIYLLTRGSLVRLAANTGNSPGLLLMSDWVWADEDSLTGAGTVTITVARLAGSNGRISVDYATSATGTPTATADVDYTSTRGRLEWADGELGAKSIQVPIINDALREGEERFQVVFSNVIGGSVLAADASTISILSSDQPAPPPAPTPAPTPTPTPAPTVNTGGGGATEPWSLLLLGGCALLLQRRRADKGMQCMKFPRPHIPQDHDERSDARHSPASKSRQSSQIFWRIWSARPLTRIRLSFRSGRGRLRRGAGRNSGRGQRSATPEGFLVAVFGRQGLTKADLSLRGCLHKAGYTNWTCLRGSIELPIRSPGT